MCLYCCYMNLDWFNNFKLTVGSFFCLFELIEIVWPSMVESFVAKQTEWLGLRRRWSATVTLNQQQQLRQQNKKHSRNACYTFQRISHMFRLVLFFSMIKGNSHLKIMRFVQFRYAGYLKSKTY